VAAARRNAGTVHSFKEGGRVSDAMRTASRTVTVLTALAVLAFLVPSALGSSVAHPTANAVVAGPAVLIKVNSNGTVGYEAGQTLNSSGTALKASWIQPKVNCTSLNATALFDTLLINSSAAQIAGTAVACSGGVASMFAWFAFLKGNTTTLTKISTAVLPVSAGSIVTVTTTVAAGTAKIVIKVGTHSVTKSKAFTGRDFIGSVGVSGLPLHGGGIAPLANFGTMAFGNAFTHVTGTNDVTFNGTKGGIGSFPLAIQLTLVDSTSKVLAAPSALSGSSSSFKVTWKAST